MKTRITGIGMVVALGGLVLASCKDSISPVPAAPTNLVAATDTAIPQIVLTWQDNSDNEEVFKIERCTGAGCTDFIEIAILPANTTSYQDQGLTEGTSYRYRVRACKESTDEYSSYSNPATATTTVLPPAAPTNLVATVASATQVNLTWADNSDDEEGFKIERCAGTGCTAFTEIATIAANMTSYQDQGLTAGSYSYQLRAHKAGKYSSYSNTVTATAGMTPPAAPTNLVATPTSASEIVLSWQDNSDNEEGFALERCTGAACATFTQIATVAVNTTSYQDQGLTAGTSYSYKVRASNAAGPSSYSNTATATTGVTPPVAPSNLVATPTSASQIVLTWQDNSDNEELFHIERCTGAGCTEFAQIATVTANTASYEDQGLTGEASYSYRVRASDIGVYSSYSNTATATIDVTVPPTAPTNLMAGGVSRYCSPPPFSGCFYFVNLTWQDNSDNETTFAIERCTGAGCTGFTEIASRAANTTSYQDRYLSRPFIDGTSYSYRVRASNAVGHSSYSNTAMATVTGPAAPTKLVATATSASEIDLTWQDNSANEELFYMERCAGAECTGFTVLVRLGPNRTSYQDQGVTSGRSYSYRVQAYRAGFFSRYSNTATATTP